jgi:hypothetical protein
MKGELDSEFSSLALLEGLQNIKEKVERALLDKITPELIMEEFGSQIFQLAQYQEIVEGVGEKELGLPELTKEILKFLPADDWRTQRVMRDKLEAVARAIAAKLIETRRRACREQGAACFKCYMQNACLQLISSCDRV